MALVSSGNQIALQGTGDTNPSGQTFHLDTTITSASTSLTVTGFSKTVEGPDTFYGLKTTLSGTVYGFKTAQTTEYSGTARLARGFDDTNPQLNGSQIKGAGFFDNSGWFGSAPANALGNETWHTSAGVVGITLGVDENALGSISTQSYTGGGSVGTLEVHQFGWFNNASSNYPNGTTLNTSSEGNWIMLVLKSTSSSPPDSNDSFYSVQINGQEFLRSDAAETISQASAAAYDSNVSSGTHYYRTWRWDAADVTDSDLTAIGTTGSKTFKLSKSASSTLNTGIAEEFGGADSSNVKFSEYYKGAASGYVNTGTGTANIPTTGNPISMSDFYGSSFVAGVVSAVTIQPAVKYDTNIGPRGGYYEFICHGLGAATHNTYSTNLLAYRSAVNTTHLTDSNQGSLVGATHPITNFGVSSTLGTLRTITHFTYGPAAQTSSVMLVIGNTGSDSNSGFTNLVATRSGMTTLTLPRSSATYLYQSGDNGARIWRWNEFEVSALANYHTGTPSSQNVDSTLFPGGSGTNNSSSSTTTTSRTTWTIS